MFMFIVVSTYMCSAFNLRAQQIAVFVETRDHEIWLDFLCVFHDGALQVECENCRGLLFS